jgi:large subunit ribosomal protein L10
VGIASLHKTRATQLQELRKKMQETVSFIVIKNSLIERAITGLEDKPNIDDLKKYLTGSNIFLFTNINPFKLVLLLQKNKIKAFAKAGDVASQDIIIPAGNTGLSPGPIISQFSSVGIKTKIESGSVKVNKDTVVAKEGEIISENLAVILSKLGIKSVEMGLSLNVIYNNGIIISKDKLAIDINEFKKKLVKAYTQTYDLSLKLRYPTQQNIIMLLKLSFINIYNLSINTNIISNETIKDLIVKAHSEAFKLYSKIPSQ